jgi:transcriptional regulator with XRE-family HTH domain
VQKTIHSSEHAAMQKVLSAARRKSGMTQSDLADRLAVPQSFVSKVERGERLLDVVEFVHYVHALDQNAAKIFSTLVREIEKSSKKPH